MTIVYLPEVYDYLEELAYTLFKKGYFAYLETAKEYVDSIVDYTNNYIINCVKHKAPPYFKRFGKNMQYITYRPNRKTTWYIFFQTKDERFLVRYITNNHAKGHHIRGLR